MWLRSKPWRLVIIIIVVIIISKNCILYHCAFMFPAQHTYFVLQSTHHTVPSEPDRAKLFGPHQRGGFYLDIMSKMLMCMIIHYMACESYKIGCCSCL